MSNDTMSAEAQALHAALADDVDDAVRILRDFLPGELWALQRACGLLGALCVDVRRDPFPGPWPVSPAQHGPHTLPPADESGVAGPGATEAPRRRPTHSRLSHIPLREGGADAAPPEPGVGGPSI